MLFMCLVCSSPFGACAMVCVRVRSFLLRDFLFSFSQSIVNITLNDTKLITKTNFCPIICWPMHLVCVISKNVNTIGPIRMQRKRKIKKNITSTQRGNLCLLRSHINYKQFKKLKPSQIKMDKMEWILCGSNALFSFYSTHQVQSIVNRFHLFTFAIYLFW